MLRKKISQVILATFLTGLVLVGCASPTPTMVPTSLAQVPANTTDPVATKPPQATATSVSALPVGTAGFPWWNDTVFYEVFVRSFFDSNGDGKGDFKGLTTKLDYLQDLGIKGLWLMPVNPSPSYHGYDVTDYYGINPDYGTMDDFKAFLSEAHKHGIRVILDLVLNHSSYDHPWFQKSKDPTSKYRDWYIWQDKDPGVTGPSGEKIWHYEVGSGYYYGLFWDKMPDLNYNNPDVTKEMLNVSKFWLDLGVDGFRLDAAKHLIEDGNKVENTPATHEWFKRYRTFYKSINNKAVTIGEVWSNSFDVIKYLKGDELDLAFGFDLARTWVNGVMAGDGAKLQSTTGFELGVFPDQQVATFLTNHDQNRVMSQLGRDEEKAKAAATILLTSPGVPFIYYGEEIGMTGVKPDERIRTPMQWSSDAAGGFTTGKAWITPNDDYDVKNVAAQQKDSKSLLNHYKTVIQARNQTEAMRIGNWIKVENTNGSVFTSLRVANNEAVLTIVNLTDQPVNDLTLSFSDPWFTGNISVKTLLGQGVFAPIQAATSGEVTGYQPATSIPAWANLVLLLTK